MRQCRVLQGLAEPCGGKWQRWLCGKVEKQWILVSLRRRWQLASLGAGG